MTDYVLEFAEGVLQRDFKSLVVDGFDTAQFGGGAGLHLVIALDNAEVVGDTRLVDGIADAFPGILEVGCRHGAAVVELRIAKLEGPHRRVGIRGPLSGHVGLELAGEKSNCTRLSNIAWTTSTPSDSKA